MNPEIPPLAAHQIELASMPVAVSALRKLLVAAEGGEVTLSATGERGGPLVLPADLAAAMVDLVSLLAVKGRAATYVFDYEHELSPRQVGQVVGKAITWTRRRIDRGQLPVRTIGDTPRINSGAFLEALSSGALEQLAPKPDAKRRPRSVRPRKV